MKKKVEFEIQIIDCVAKRVLFEYRKKIMIQNL